MSVAVACFMAVGTSLKTVHENRRRYRRPCELPVLNLEFCDGDFEKAKQSFITDLWKWLDLGRKNASAPIHSALDSLYGTSITFQSQLTFHSSRRSLSSCGAPRATLSSSPTT